MFYHTVVWKMAGDTLEKRAELAQEFAMRLIILEEAVSEVLELRTAVNSCNDSDAAWDISLFTAFRSQEDFQIYMSHPAHLKVIEWLKGKTTARAVVDGLG